MNLPLFLARRIQHSEKESSENRKRRISRPAVRIATLGVAIGMCIMILSVAVVIGFKKEIRSKVIGLGSHIQVSNYVSSPDHRSAPIYVSDTLHRELASMPGIRHIQRYSDCSGIIVTDEAFQGVMLKGMAQDYDTAFLHRTLVEGRLPKLSDRKSSQEIAISRSMAHKLRLSIGDRVHTYFIDREQLRARRFTVAGIYQTNFSDIDDVLVLTDLYTVNRLNGWQEKQMTGLEIAIDRYDQLPLYTGVLASRLDRRPDPYGGFYQVLNVEQLNPNVFAWLGLLDMNVWVILILMIGIAGFTMISGLLIIILERTSMIGLLKALGASNRTLRSTFLYVALHLVGRGMLYGNLAALVLYFAQRQWGMFKLDPDTYYIDRVPMELNLPVYLLLNAATFLLSLLMLIAPTYLITRISPARSIRYE